MLSNSSKTAFRTLGRYCNQRLALLLVSCVFPSYDNAQDPAARIRQLTGQKPINGPQGFSSPEKHQKEARFFLPGGSWVPSGEFNPIRLSTAPETRCFPFESAANIIFICIRADLNTGTPARRPESSENQQSGVWQSLDGPGVSKSCPLH